MSSVADQLLLLPGTTSVRRRPPLDLSVTGAVYLAMLLFMGAAMINSQANLLFGVFGLMVGILLVSYIISKLVLRKISIERMLPEHAVVGQTCVFTYEIRNTKRFWPSLSVTVAELDAGDAFARQPQAYLLHVAAKMTATIPCEVVPRRRGLHQFERYQISTSFPFGFIKRADLHRRRDSILIYPALAEVHPRVLALARSAETTGALMRPRRGGTDEFYGVKEYRDGESPRWIYWRRSARTGTLVAKEMTHVSPPRLMIVLDTYLPEVSRSAIEANERAIAMAASLASHALEAGLPVGLTVWSNEPTEIAPNRGKRQRRDLLTVLARLPRNREYPVDSLLKLTSAQRRSGTTNFLITPRQLHLGLAEQSRGGTIVLSPRSEQSSAWFKFHPEIDFSVCEPEVERTFGFPAESK
jgi:uncharacterized protein (DUF58 family)